MSKVLNLFVMGFFSILDLFFVYINSIIGHFYLDMSSAHDGNFLNSKCMYRLFYLGGIGEAPMGTNFKESDQMEEA